MRESFLSFSPPVIGAEEVEEVVDALPGGDFRCSLRYPHR